MTLTFKVGLYFSTMNQPTEFHHPMRLIVQKFSCSQRNYKEILLKTSISLRCATPVDNQPFYVETFETFTHIYRLCAPLIRLCTVRSVDRVSVCVWVQVGVYTERIINSNGKISIYDDIRFSTTRKTDGPPQHRPRYPLHPSDCLSVCLS